LQDPQERFSIPFPKDRTIYRKTFDLLRLACSNCTFGFYTAPGSPKKRLEPFRHSRRNNRPVGKQYDEEYPVQRSFDRVREAYEPIRERSCPKLLRFQCADLDVIKGRHKVGKGDKEASHRQGPKNELKASLVQKLSFPSSSQAGIDFVSGSPTAYVPLCERCERMRAF
jgi:hypothetical protein